MIQSLDRFTAFPGDQPSAEGINTLLGEATQIGNIIGSYPVRVERFGGGVVVSLDDDGWFYAKLTSESSGKYAWTEVEPATAGTWATKSQGRSGTTTASYAVELNAVSGIAANTIVRLYKGFANASATSQQEYVFSSGMPTVMPSGLTFSGCQCTNSGTITLLNAVLTLITFDTEVYDIGGYHSTSSNTSRITIPTTGYYHFDAFVGIDPHATGYRYLQVLLNGGEILGQSGDNSGGGIKSHLACSWDWKATAGDYFELMAAQASGITLLTTADAPHLPRFSCHSLGV